MVVRDDYEAVQGTYPPDVIHNPEHAAALGRMCGLLDRLVDPLARVECKPCRVQQAREREAEAREHAEARGEYDGETLGRTYHDVVQRSRLRVLRAHLVRLYGSRVH
jgi:hypothetical protein